MSEDGHSLVFFPLAFALQRPAGELDLQLRELGALESSAPVSQPVADYDDLRMTMNPEPPRAKQHVAIVGCEAAGETAEVSVNFFQLLSDYVRIGWPRISS